MKPETIYCPFCNAQGQAQPVLVPLSATLIVPQLPPQTGPRFEYRCGRCGFVEIHDRQAGQAA